MSKFEFHSYVEKKVGELQYGELVVSVTIKKGVPMLNTLKSVKRRRLKYSQPKADTRITSPSVSDYNYGK